MCVCMCMYALNIITPAFARIKQVSCSNEREKRYLVLYSVVAHTEVHCHAQYLEKKKKKYDNPISTIMLIHKI